MNEHSDLLVSHHQPCNTLLLSSPIKSVQKHFKLKLLKFTKHFPHESVERVEKDEKETKYCQGN